MYLSLRAGPASRLVAQRVASLIPALNPEQDVARPAAQRTPESVTLASSAGYSNTPGVRRTLNLAPGVISVPPPPPTRAPTPASPPAAARVSRHDFDDDVAVDDEPTQLQIPTVPPSAGEGPAPSFPAQFAPEPAPPLPPRRSSPPQATLPPPLPRSAPAPVAVAREPEVVDPPTRPMIANPP
ncbi:MAG: hypothetical protein R3A52_13905 [Polyangiales bacterium]